VAFLHPKPRRLVFDNKDVRSLQTWNIAAKVLLGYHGPLAGRKPPDPREGSNPTSRSSSIGSVARSSCRLLRIQAQAHGELTVDKNLPARPNLDHLRRQAKSLLSALASGDSEA
jgi:hypothetical protein